MNAVSWFGFPLARRLLAAVFVTAAPLIVIGGLLLAFWVNERRTIVLQGNLERARLGAAFVTGWVQSHERTLATLAASNEVRAGDVGEMQALVLRQVRAQPEWQDLFITNAQGVIIASRIGTGVSVADRAYFQTALATGQPAVSNLLISRLTQQEIVVIAFPYIIDGAIAGVVAAAIYPAQLQRIFSDVPAMETGVFSLWGDDQQLIAQSAAADTAVGIAAIADNLPMIIARSEGAAVVRDPSTGERMLIGFHPVAGAPWTLVSGMDYAATFAPVYRAVGLFALFAILTLLGVLSWSLRITRQITGDLDKITQASRAIGNGNFTTRVTLDPRSDLAPMGNAINRMAERLDVSERMKFDLITLVSHELKTPLTAIISAQALLPREAETAELLAIIARQSDHLKEMIENLISIARMQAGTLVACPRSLPLKPLIRDLIRHMNELHNGTAVPIIDHTPTALRVLADAHLTTLALHNLLENARKFTAQGEIVIHAQRENNHVTVTVTDTGIGFDAAMLEKFFQPFMQHEPLLTRHREGIGMGLAVVRAVVTVQGGAVFARSPGPGQGSTFGFTLPLPPEG